MHNFILMGGKKDMNIIKKYFIIGLIIFFIGASITPNISGDIYSIFDNSPDIVYVDDDYNETTPGWGYDHFDNIRDGIDAVADEGTVLVYDGIYNEVLFISFKSIHLIGIDKEKTIIHSSGLNHDIIIIQKSGVTIQGFTLTYYGGNQHIPTGILISPDLSNIDISDCIFTNMNHGIYFQNTSR